MKTRDGVDIVPGMKVYWFRHDVLQWLTVQQSFSNTPTLWPRTYSTEHAAKKGRAAELREEAAELIAEAERLEQK